MQIAPLYKEAYRKIINTKQNMIIIIMIIKGAFIKMTIAHLFTLAMAKLCHAKSELTSGHCDRHMRLVNAKYIADETLSTKVGISNGEPILNHYLNQTRFVQEIEPNCAKACFK